MARAFHSAVVRMVVDVCVLGRAETGVDQVVLSGGVFQNALLLEEVPAALAAEGFRVFRHARVPANDGGISLGQLAVAAGRDSR